MNAFTKRINHLFLNCVQCSLSTAMGKREGLLENMERTTEKDMGERGRGTRTEMNEEGTGMQDCPMRGDYGKEKDTSKRILRNND
jgi:hypothetical protein